MSSHQDSPKEPEQEWPWPTHRIARVLVKLARGPVVPGNYFYAIRHGDEPTDDEETYIPVSALVSDEAKAAVAEALSDADFTVVLSEKLNKTPLLGGEITWAELAEIALQAAIEHVGGQRG